LAHPRHAGVDTSAALLSMAMILGGMAMGTMRT
jgi:hypothetical protein